MDMTYPAQPKLQQQQLYKMNVSTVDTATKTTTATNNDLLTISSNHNNNNSNPTHETMFLVLKMNAFFIKYFIFSTTNIVQLKMC